MNATYGKGGYRSYYSQFILINPRSLGQHGLKMELASTSENATRLNKLKYLYKAKQVLFWYLYIAFRHTRACHISHKWPQPWTHGLGNGPATNTTPQPTPPQKFEQDDLNDWLQKIRIYISYRSLITVIKNKGIDDWLILNTSEARTKRETNSRGNSKRKWLSRSLEKPRKKPIN